MTKEEKSEEENKDRARLWLLGQKVAKRNFKPEAFNKFWSEKRAREEQEEREENKRNE